MKKISQICKFFFVFCNFFIYKYFGKLPALGAGGGFALWVRIPQKKNFFPSLIDSVPTLGAKKLNYGAHNGGPGNRHVVKIWQL